MRVHVDTARNDETILRVENLIRILNRKILANRGNQSVRNAHVARVGIRCSNDCSVADDGIKSHDSPTDAGAIRKEFRRYLSADECAAGGDRGFAMPVLL